jgi:hypothetical protein
MAGVGEGGGLAAKPKQIKRKGRAGCPNYVVSSGETWAGMHNGQAPRDQRR